MKKHTTLGSFTRSFTEIILILTVMSLLITSSNLLANTQKSTNSSKLNLVIDDIICRNNDNTECPFILKKYYQNIGDLVDPDEIADAKLRLGTLQQIIAVRVSLEKSNQRGHVNVVFIVEESSQVQYSLSAGFDGRKINAANGRNSHDLKWSNYSLTAGVANYNFLGSAKQLSFSVGSNYGEFDSKQPNTTTIFSDGQSFFQSFDMESKNASAQLNYYDPHLFGSVNYFLSADIAYAKSENINDSFVRFPDGEIQRFGNTTIKSNHYGLAIGRRFASFSHISLQYRQQGFDLEDNNNPSLFAPDQNDVSLSYGWDSRDDLIFPTKGSLFNVALNGLTESDSKYLNVSYTDNFTLSDDKVFSYSISDSFAYVDGGKGRKTELSPIVSLAWSDIDFSGSKNGNYAGWKYRVSLPLRDFDVEDISVGVTYTRQTNSLILKFSLEYLTDWRDIL